jgi:glycine/D-amino acid oxidase-like deaminating enzyme
MLGEPWADRLIARQTQANARVAEMIQRYQIQCEWQQNGYVMAAARPSAIAALEQKVRDYNAVGAKTRFVDRAGVEAITGSPRFFGGWFHTEGDISIRSAARAGSRARLYKRARSYSPDQG